MEQNRELIYAQEMLEALDLLNIQISLKTHFHILLIPTSRLFKRSLKLSNILKKRVSVRANIPSFRTS